MEQIEVRVKGQLDASWSDWLGGLAVTHTADGETILTGPVRDQSAMFGLLNRLPGLGLRLISLVSRSASSPAETRRCV